MFTVKSKYFILKFRLSLKLATLLCTVSIINKGKITAVLFGYSTDSFTYKLYVSLTFQSLSLFCSTNKGFLVIELIIF